MKILFLWRTFSKSAIFYAFPECVGTFRGVPISIWYMRKRVPPKTSVEYDIYKSALHEKKYFFRVVKKFPQIIENTREIIENMSEIF